MKINTIFVFVLTVLLSSTFTVSSAHADLAKDFRDGIIKLNKDLDKITKSCKSCRKAKSEREKREREARNAEKKKARNLQRYNSCVLRDEAKYEKKVAQYEAQLTFMKNGDRNFAKIAGKLAEAKIDLQYVEQTCLGKNPH